MSQPLFPEQSDRSPAGRLPSGVVPATASELSSRGTSRSLSAGLLHATQGAHVWCSGQGITCLGCLLMPDTTYWTEGASRLEEGRTPGLE